MNVLKTINGTQVLIDDETGEVLDEIFFKTPYNHDRDQESQRVGLTCQDESLTDQSQAPDADINNIVKRYLHGQALPVPLPEQFGDATDRPQTWLEIQQILATNNATFYRLPPEIRAEFLNNPALWMDQIDRDLATGDLDNLERCGMDVKALREELAKSEKEAADKANAKEAAEQAAFDKRLADRLQGASPAPEAKKPDGGSKSPPKPAKSDT